MPLNASVRRLRFSFWVNRHVRCYFPTNQRKSANDVFEIEKASHVLSSQLLSTQIIREWDKTDGAEIFICSRDYGLWNELNESKAETRFSLQVIPGSCSSGRRKLAGVDSRTSSRLCCAASWSDCCSWTLFTYGPENSYPRLYHRPCRLPCRPSNAMLSSRVGTITIDITNELPNHICINDCNSMAVTQNIIQFSIKIKLFCLEIFLTL